MKVAIIYDWIDSEGGIERVIPSLIKNFKNPDIYSSYVDKNRAKWAKDLNIKTTFLQNFPNFIKNNRILSFIFYPYAFESLNLNNYDVVISVSSSFAKSVITNPKTLHICYMLTPTRYFWIDEKSYFKNPLIKFFANIFLSKLKKWDYVSAQRPDYIISISETVKQRVKKYYKRDSIVIYPSFNIDYWNKIKKTIKENKIKDKSFYLLVSRLEYYKKTEIAIHAFNELNKKLIIVGLGSQLQKLQNIANNNIEFKQNMSDIELASLYSSAKALIMPQSEEFGLVALESLFFNSPVISYKNSGVKEIAVENKTAIFFDKQDANSLLKAVVRFEAISYNLKKSTQDLDIGFFQKFETKSFLQKFNSFINKIIKNKDK